MFQSVQVQNKTMEMEGNRPDPGPANPGSSGRTAVKPAGVCVSQCSTLAIPQVNGKWRFSTPWGSVTP